MLPVEQGLQQVDQQSQPFFISAGEKRDGKELAVLCCGQGVVFVSLRLLQERRGTVELPESLEDLAEPEIAIAAVAVGVLFSPRVRRGVRRGLVAGIAGVLAAGDGIVSLARQLPGVGRRAPDSTFRQQLVSEARIEQMKRARAQVDAQPQGPS